LKPRSFDEKDETMLGGLTGWHALILLAIILLLFGAPKLPALARSVGQSMKIFRNEIKDPKVDSGEADDAADETPSKPKK
jgi:sec-independent protein translocase protein TatA